MSASLWRTVVAGALTAYAICGVAYAGPLPPVILPITNQTVNEDESLDVDFTITDADNAQNELTVSAHSSSQTVVPDANLTLVDNVGSNRTVRIKPAADQNGLVTITLTASDGTTTNVTRTFNVDILPVNDPPKIDAIADQSMDEDGTLDVDFTVSDIDNVYADLSVTGHSTSQTIVPDARITFPDQAGPDRTVRIRPAKDENGSLTIELTISDGETNSTTSFDLDVDPVNDPPVIDGVVLTTIGDNVNTQLFAAITITDVDHNKPNAESLTVEATLVTETGAAAFTGGASGQLYTTAGYPSVVSGDLEGVLVAPVPNLLPVGQYTTITVLVSVTDGVLSTSVTSEVSIESINDPPSAEIRVTPSVVADDREVQPFTIDIADPDPGDNNRDVAVQVEPIGTDDFLFGTLTPSRPAYTGTLFYVQSAVANIKYTPHSITSNSTERFLFRVIDSFGAWMTNVVELIVQPTPDPPVISGVSQTILRTTDDPNAAPINPFAAVRITDADAGDWLTVVLSLDPLIGALDPITFSGSAADVTHTIQGVAFTASQLVNRVIGDVTTTRARIVVTDSSGLSRTNSNTQIAVTAVNGGPVIATTPESIDQPFPVAPQLPLTPFADMGVIIRDDDTNLTVTVTLDHAAKGDLSITNLTLSDRVGFAEVSSGQYRLVGSPADLTLALSNIVYTINAAYLFSPNAPGDTTFSILAVDSVLNRTTRALRIVIQNERRTHLVVTAGDDLYPADYSEVAERGRPVHGCLRRAVLDAANGDVIAFALPAYPARIRLRQPISVTNNLTFSGPGADLLTVSGDTNGDTQPDTQLFRVYAWVMMQGMTLTRGTAVTGGAVYVGVTNPIPDVVQYGFLTMRACAVTDSHALQWGGAIDVDQGGLVLEECLLRGNATDAAFGLGGGAVSLYTDVTNPVCAFVNTTFAENRQQGENGFGGGAIYVENYSPATQLPLAILNSTFKDNADASGGASAVAANVFGTEVEVRNSIFADGRGRGLSVMGAAAIVSGGGNVADDSTRVTLIQGGVPKDVFLLGESSDRRSVDPRLSALDERVRPTPLYPLMADSPARGNAVGDVPAIDQHGARRERPGDAGAAEFEATERLVLNELFVAGGTNEAAFLEFYVPRDSATRYLDGYSVYVDNVKRHTFAAGAVIRPGYGIVIADTTGLPVVAADGATPVVAPSAAPLALNPRGLIEVKAPSPDSRTVLAVSYVARFADPAAPDSTLDTSHNSITLAPQFVGFAYVPHSAVLNPPLGGVDLSALSSTAGVTSPGADTSSTPFGSANARPEAVLDTRVVNEDTLVTIPVLNNDLDADGLDRLVVVDVSTTALEGGDDPLVLSFRGAAVAVTPATIDDPGADPLLRGEAVMYDPTAVRALQALPEGAKTTDSFYYTTVDIGTGPIAVYSNAPASATAVYSPAHRLTNGEEIVISGSSITNYNGLHTITTVIDRDAFTIPVAFAGAPAVPGAWETRNARRTTARSTAIVSLSVLGANDPPTPTNDVAAAREDEVIRILGAPDLIGSGTVFETDDDYPTPPTLSATALLVNDGDPDSDDSAETLTVIGVVSNAQPVVNYTGTAGTSPVTVTSPAHGLADGDTVLISGYRGHPSYCGSHAVEVIDEDHFSIPVAYVDNAAEKGVWAVLTDENRLEARSVFGALVTLDLRAVRAETSVIYDPRDSVYLDGLAVGETVPDTFYYAAADRHGAVSLARVTVNVSGVNDLPVTGNDPDALAWLADAAGGEALSNVLNRLNVLYLLPPASHESGRMDVKVDIGGPASPEPLSLANLWTTDEDTPLSLPNASLLSNDSDVDRSNVLRVAQVSATTRRGAAVTMEASALLYDPRGSAELDALAREEVVIDTFEIVVGDGSLGGEGLVTSLVAVVVTGVNDAPRAAADAASIPEDQLLVLRPPTGTVDNDAEDDINGVVPDNQLALIPFTNRPSAAPATAVVSIAGNALAYDPRDSAYLNGLALGQTYTDTVATVVTDGSTLFANDDIFGAEADASSLALDVLANDRNFTRAAATGMRIVDVGTPDNGGAVALGTARTNLLYTPLVNFVGDEVFTYTVADGTDAFDAQDFLELAVLVDRLNNDTNGVAPFLMASFSSNTVARVRHFAGEYPDGELRTALADDLNGLLSGTIYSAERFAGVELSPLSQKLVAQGVSGDRLAFLNRRLLEEAFPAELKRNHTDRALVTVRVIIDSLNGNLVANDDAYSVARGETARLDVLANDNVLPAAGGDLLLTAITTSPDAGGSAAISGDTILYTPGTNGTPAYPYVETLQYEVSGGGTARATGTVRIRVINREDTLHTRDDAFSVLYASRENYLDVLANDSILPVATESLSIRSVSGASHGTVSAAADGRGLLYTPDSAFVGREVLTYVATDGMGGTGPGTVTIYVGEVRANNDAFAFEHTTNASPSAVTLPVLSNDRVLPAATASSLTVVSVSPAGAAIGMIDVATDGRALVFKQAPGIYGDAVFTYTVSDGAGRRAMAEVALTVMPPGIELNASPDYFTVRTDSIANLLTVVANDLGESLSIASVGTGLDAPNHGGTVTIGADSATLVYSPAAGFSGEETFTYTMTDSADVDTVKVVVDVVAGTLTAVVDAYTVFHELPEGPTPSFADADILDLPALVAQLKTPTNGLSAYVRGALSADTVTLLTNYSGSGEAPALVNALVSDFNRIITTNGPIVTNAVTAGIVLSDHAEKLLDESLAGDPLAYLNRRILLDGYRGVLARPDAVSFTLPVLDNDTVLPDFGRLLTIVAIGNATNMPSMHGTVAIAEDGSALIYTPAIDAGLPYTERFTYEISDGGSRRARAAVELYVLERTEVEDVEVGDDRFEVEADSMNNELPVLRNDNILPAVATGWSIDGVSAPVFGGLVEVSGDMILYTPQPGFVGTDRFSYTVADGQGGTRQAAVSVKVGNLMLLDDRYEVVANGGAHELDVLANDGVLPGGPTEEFLLESVGASSMSGTVSVVEHVVSNDTVVATNRLVSYRPSTTYTGRYPYVETFEYVVMDDSRLTVTGMASIVVHGPQSDRGDGVLTVTVIGVNDLPTIDGTRADLAITDKESGAPFAGVTIGEVDDQGMEPVTVSVVIDDPVKGVLRNLGGFVQAPPGTYSLQGVAADITPILRGLEFVPTENRITVPVPEPTRFSLRVSDGHLPTVTDNVSVVTVTPVNDPPVIAGTRAGQTVYHRLSLRPFSSVTVSDVDDLRLQPLSVTVSLDVPSHGYLELAGSVVSSTAGVFNVSGVTAAQATERLRALVFVPTTDDRVPPAPSETTRLTVAVDDGFAPPVTDAATTVIARDSLVKELPAKAGSAARNGGVSVATTGELLAVGIPHDVTNGVTCGTVKLRARDLGGPEAWGMLMTVTSRTVVSYMEFGHSVALSDDSLAVGSPNDRNTGNLRAGAVYVFDRTQGGTNAWGQVAKVTAPDGLADDRFGCDVALDGDTLVVGASGNRNAGLRTGSAYVYERNAGGPGVWGFAHKIVPSGLSGEDAFGQSVAIEGDTIVVGAPGQAASARPRPTFVYRRNLGGANAWGREGALLPTPLDDDEHFGFDVAVTEGRIGVTSLDALSNGRAHVFEASASGGSNLWTQVELLVPEGSGGDAYGSAVALDDGLLAVGSRLDESTNGYGSAYVYAADWGGAGTWGAVDKVIGTVAYGDVEFGRSIALRRNTMVVGTGSGSVYVYRLKFNNAPAVAADVPDQLAELLEPFVYALPPGTFADPDRGDALVLSAAMLDDGGAVPAWLAFDPASGTFSGTPTNGVGTVRVWVTATDRDGAHATAAFEIMVVLPDVSALELWRLRRFGAAAVLDPAQEATVWGDDADPDGDGLRNIVEYVFGSDPHSPAGAPDSGHILTVSAVATGEFIEIRYPRRTDDPALTFALEVSNDLLTWHDGSSLVQSERTAAIDDERAMVTLTVRSSDLPGTWQYFRVSVTY